MSGGVKYRGRKMTRDCASVLRRVYEGLSYAEIAQQTGLQREKIKRWVQYHRAQGMDIPVAPRSTPAPRKLAISPKTALMIELAKKGMCAEKIAVRVGLDKCKVRRALSYHRCKGEPIPMDGLPLDEYEHLHRQGMAQKYIAEKLGITTRRAGYCAEQLVRLGRIESPRKAKADDVPKGRDLWAIALGRKSLF